MTPRVILPLAISHPDRLAAFVEREVAARAETAAISGPGGGAVAGRVMDVVVGGGRGTGRVLATPFHADGIVGGFAPFAGLRPETAHAVHGI